MTERQETSGELIYAVVVTFNPNISVLRKLVERLTNQVNGVIIIDNNSRDKGEIQNLVDDKNTAELINLTENRGLGYAHNVGIKCVRERGGSYVLLLDQDSVPSETMVVRLLQVANKIRNKMGRVAAVGARYVGSYAGNDSFFVQFGRTKFKRVFCPEDGTTARYVRADFLISSGTLIPIDTLDAIGGMDEALFIDHVDTEWFLRANDRGYLSFGACDALMEHGLGEDTLRVWFGRWRYLPKHRPFRYYYIFRNSIILYRRPYAPARWIWNDLIRLVFIFVFFGAVSKPRTPYLKMMWRGMRDGIRGITGGTVLPA